MNKHEKFLVEEACEFSTEHFMVEERQTYQFPNRWGASLISTHFSHGGRSGYWELAVLRWKEDGTPYLHYRNPIAKGDVRGWLSGEEAVRLLERIKRFPAARPAHCRREAV